jgi:phytoene dehydrogenase-like protein
VLQWLRDYDTAIRDYVRSPYLREILRNYATNIGSNPYKSPGYLNYLTHQELVGTWYLRGGMLMLAQVLQRIAIDMGVKIITKTPVAEILVSDKEVRGVLLQTG